MFLDFFLDFSKTIPSIYNVRIYVFKIGNSDFVHKFVRYLDNIQTWFKIQTRIATHQGQIKLNAEIVLLETAIV